MKAGRPLRGPEPEGSGFAAAHLLRAAARQAGGRAARGYGAAPPASRLLRTAARRPAAGPDPGDLCGPLRQDIRAGPSLLHPGARRVQRSAPGTQTNVRKRSELAFDTQKKRQNYTNPL